jgi:NAD(P)-dependent dehydrogenase (short-subunit alcohol dehydrogenase family)
MKMVVAGNPAPGSVAIVTGGTRGIGRAIAQALLATGCDVFVFGRSAPEAAVSSDGREATFIACDVRDPDQVTSAVAQVGAARGRIDILVNNAGGSPSADASSASPRFSQAIIGLNLLGPIYLSQTVHAWMGEGGAIVNIASVAAQRPAPSVAAYGAAKAGLVSLTQSLAQEWGPRIRVNAIIVGLVATEAADATYGGAEGRAEIGASLPLGRMGTGEDIASAVLFLCSPQAAYISGARLNVDGGGERPLFIDILDRQAAARIA